MKTDVAIIGGGPSGLLLSQILMRAGISTVVLERRSRPQVLARIRAGVLELHLLAPSVEALDGIKQAMSRDGAQVELQSANPRDQQIEGRLQVRLGAA